ncbi:hypothetical protein [Sphaerotilus microaerophilus]|uniref:Major capsid protein n=1 Tax=Sphaerotilus microaerophilus TaxID=2914710 RepID=A0ABN6PLL2_9BURK|nr:hypothetical protein [Sphaerotilus sp. FB-5]BDI06069.1 hypothetical protein CATMQ487_30390 [Sphaerotilus sp. FB-5]
MDRPLNVAGTAAALPGPFDTAPQPQGITITPPVSKLVHAQVRALLESSPAFHDLPPSRREVMGRDLEKIAAYTAALVHEEWAQSKRLGQTPVLHQRESLPVAAAQDGSLWEPQPVQTTQTALAAALPAQTLANKEQEHFDTRATGQVGRITRDTVNAIAFPTFVADLIKGTFQAIVNASIQQMEAYGALLANVSKTVDQFMADNISDNNARDWVANAYPSHFKIDTSGERPRIVVRDGADSAAKPDFRGTLGLNEDVDVSDEAGEEKLVPAARRYLAKSRHQMLSTMMLMGINRIVITSGRIYARMGFQINAQDLAQAESASQFDMRHQHRVGFGGGLAGLLGGASGEASTSVAYVSSKKANSSDAIDVHADLTGEVDLKFKSDYFPMERFAKPELMSLIMGNTPNPTANTPVNSHGGEGKAVVPAPAA